MPAGSVTGRSVNQLCWLTDDGTKYIKQISHEAAGIRAGTQLHGHVMLSLTVHYWANSVQATNSIPLQLLLVAATAGSKYQLTPG